jgi:sugar O-acyltransferase (sialic acid O-acetyltransferase NeuD family)
LKSLAIIGSNDLGKLIAYHAQKSGWEISGFIDNFKEKGSIIEKFGKVLGKENEIESLHRSGLFELIIVGVGYTQFEYRQSVFEKLKGKVPFGNVIHSSSFIDDSVQLGEGIFILPGVIVDRNVTLCDNVLLNTGCIIAHDSIIRQHSFIAPGVTIAGKVDIGECNFVGVGSTILDGITTCSKVTIGGGAVVTKDINTPGLYIGIPAKRSKDNIYIT